MTRDEILCGILSIDWDIHETYGQSYLTIENTKRYEDLISKGRLFNLLSLEEVSLFKSICNNGNKHRIELEAHLRNQPRRDAQAFISKKNIREWLFKRDGGCLCCGRADKLSVDHIRPVNRGGKNRLGNLQTLCSSCNSWKSDNYIDFR